jgi:hypothetical protein
MADFSKHMFTWAATQMIEIAQQEGTPITWRMIYQQLHIPETHWYNNMDLDTKIPYLTPRDIVSLVEDRFNTD